MIRTWLDHCLPFDAHKLCTDRVTIAIRQVPSTRCYDSTSLKLSSAPMAGNGVSFAVPDEGSPYRRLFGQRSRYRTVFFNKLLSIDVLQTINAVAQCPFCWMVDYPRT